MEKFKTSGFTLLETLIYAGIVTLMLTFALLTIYQLIDADDHVLAKKELVENQKFLVEKFAWVLQNVQAVNAPASGATGTILSVNKLGYSFNPLVLSLTTPSVYLLSGATSTPITNRFASVTSLTFYATSTSVRLTAILSNQSGSTSIDITIPIK